MKSIIVLLVAAMALVGFASAWDSTNVLQYQYTKTVNMQADEKLSWLECSDSGANFGSNGAYGHEFGSVYNKLKEACTDNVEVYGCAYDTPTDTHNVLTQGGLAVVYTASPNTEAPCDILKAGYAMATQDLALSGFYNDASAKFGQVATVGIDGICAKGTTWDTYGKVEMDDPTAAFVEADIGSKIDVGFKEMNGVSAFRVPTLSGSHSAWATFDGAVDFNDGSAPYDVEVKTTLDGCGNFELDAPTPGDIS